jgi:peptidoglycan/LPS O-acetylase OafA/YrhL
MAGLRGIACLAVFMVHFQQQTGVDGEVAGLDLKRLLVNGNTGVALFFMLSAFLLAMPFWRSLEHDQPLPGLAGFWVRRLARILPAYYVCLTGLVVLGRQWQEPGGLSDILLHYALLFGFRDATIFSINPPFWTLAVECQFYLLLPLPFLIFRQASNVVRAVVLLALSVCAYVLFAFMARGTANAAPGAALTYSLIAHLPHFLLGMAAALLHLRLSRALKHRSNGARMLVDVIVAGAAVGLVLILGTPMEDVLQVPYGRYNWPFVPILIAVIVCFVPFGRASRALLEAWPLRTIGLVSYGVYLFHLPIQHVTARWLTASGGTAGGRPLTFGVVSLAGTLLVASMSYVFIERPLLRRAREFRADSPGTSDAH